VKFALADIVNSVKYVCEDVLTSYECKDSSWAFYVFFHSLSDS